MAQRTPSTHQLTGENRFWKRFLRTLISGNKTLDLPRNISADSIVKRGQANHLLEFLSEFSKNYSNISTLPERVLTEARRQQLRTWQRNRKIRECMNTISELVDGEMQYAWLKGASFLSRDRYPPGTRRMSDIDILGRKHDLKRWIEIMNQIGFKSYRDPDWLMSESFSNHVSSTVFVRHTKNQSIMIDFHWHLIDFPARRACGRWNFDMQPVFSGITEHQLDPIHHLLYVMDHAFSHSFRIWKSFIDMNKILCQNSLDGHRILSEAQRWGIDTIIRMTDRLYERLSGQSIFRGFKIEDPLPADRIRFINRALKDRLRVGDYLKTCFKELESFRQKAKFFGYILFPPSSAMPELSSRPSWTTLITYGIKRLKKIGINGSKIILDST